MVIFIFYLNHLWRKKYKFILISLHLWHVLCLILYKRKHTVESNMELIVEQDQAYSFCPGSSVAVGDSLVEEYQGLVMSVAKHYVNHRVQLEDLLQEGYMGLVKAASRFDDSQGCRFSTYATYWIRHNIRRYIAKYGRLVHLPIKKNELYRKILKVIELLKLERSEDPTIADIAEYAGMTEEEVSGILDIFGPELSFESPLGDNGASFYEIIEDKVHKSPEDAYFSREMEGEICYALNGLMDKERLILKKRYGIEEGGPVTLKEIGDEFKISSETVRQIEKRAIQKIKSGYAYLREYL